ncbi:MAG: hypothetical protein AAFQ82_04405 [Myxococcota bacterium]
MSRSENVRWVALAVLLAAVLGVGLPWGTAAPGDAFQMLTEPLAVDVSMTPVTADMAGLFDADGSRLYAYDIDVVMFRDGRRFASRELRTLALEHFKVPGVLWVERIAVGSHVPDLESALCRSLKLETGLAFDSFSFVLPDAPGVGKQLGFNTLIRCTAR